MCSTRRLQRRIPLLHHQLLHLSILSLSIDLYNYLPILCSLCCITSCLIPSHESFPKPSLRLRQNAIFFLIRLQVTIPPSIIIPTVSEKCKRGLSSPQGEDSKTNNSTRNKKPELCGAGFTESLSLQRLRLMTTTTTTSPRRSIPQNPWEVPECSRRSGNLGMQGLARCGP